MTHTPGPWVVEYSSKGHPYAINAPGDTGIPGAVGHVVRWRGIGFPTSERARANALLMAASPDMLEALQETVLQLQYLADKFGETGTGAAVLARVNAAIAKATGE